MPTLGDGTFSFTINSGDLAKGLRPTKRSPRNTKFLTKCQGAVGLDNVLQALADITEDRIDTSALVGVAFPYPQLFVFSNLIIVCLEAKIYEYTGGSLVLKLDVTGSEGITWSAVDYFDFIYMSNGVVSVTRDPNSKVFAVSATLPLASGICNYNGQCVIGAPDVDWS